MKIYKTTESFRPSSELKFRLRKLAEIGAFAKSLNQIDLFNKTKQLHDKLVDDFNAQGKEATKRSFWGKMLDEITWTERYAEKLAHMEDCLNYRNSLNLAEGMNHQLKSNSSITIWMNGNKAGIR